jgi:diguanylate cyclase (GGDEF)-like protein
VDPGAGAATPPSIVLSLDEVQLRAAVDADRVEVHFQPVVLLPSRHVVGFEALARVRLDDGRLVSPAGFIPLAESSGLITAVGDLVLDRALARAARWRSAGGPLATATVSVNVAPHQLTSLDYVDRVHARLVVHDVPSSALVLEITESAASSPHVRPVLERLAAAGVRIALDDFGVGFATLDNLRRLPVQILKLDRSFVAGVTQAGADRTIARVVVDLADSLGLSLIAEGVESLEQADALERLGCPVVQGFYFAHAQADPEAAAAQVRALGPASAGPPGDQIEGWSVELDTAVIAAARLLATGPDAAQRAALHAFATGLARALGMLEAGVRTVGRLALVHDLHRLAVDGVLPTVLADAPQLRDLVHSARPARLEVEIIRAAQLAAHRAYAGDRSLRETACAAGMLHAAAALREHEPRLASALVRLSVIPPEVVPLAEVIDDLDRRRVGRRGMEERLRSLAGISRVLASARDSLELLRIGAEEARRIVGAASASMERWDRQTGRLTTLVNVGQLGPGEEVFPRNEAYALADSEQARRTLLSGLPYLHTLDDLDVPPAEIALLKRLHKYSSAAVPVYLNGRVWGQVWLTTGVGEPAFAATDIETLTAVATLMGAVVAQAENLDRVSLLAFEDPLTRVANRRAVDDALDQLAATRTPALVALLDVDQLGAINATSGPAQGDRLLVDLAEGLSRAVVRWPGATVGRLGGDEFCLVLPEAQPTDAKLLVAAALEHAAGPDGPPEISVGYAMSRGPWTPRDLMAEADRELYLAKGMARERREQATARTDAQPSGGSGTT